MWRTVLHVWLVAPAAKCSLAFPCGRVLDTAPPRAAYGASAYETGDDHSEHNLTQALKAMDTF
jgi:hypothetical protein